MTCHSKQRAQATFDLGNEFIDEEAVKSLTPSALAELQIATRQFDGALKTYETIFSQPEYRWETLSMIGAFERYLRVSVVVREDIARATKTLEKYTKRSGLDPGAVELIGTWIETLKGLDLAAAEGNELAVARETVKEAQRTTRYPSDRANLVNFIASTALLHRYLQSDQHADAEVAETYYLLAIAESNITTSYWISETDFLLEQAIRKAPKSPVAKEAYEFLVAYTTSGHAMLARNIPENVTHNLEELRALMAE
jgi:hypothetical protein